MLYVKILILILGDIIVLFIHCSSQISGVRKAKFVSKDATRYEAMIAGVLEHLGESFENVVATKVVLLAVDGTICRRNTLNRLHRNGVVVMRCPVDDDDDSSSSSEESDSSSEESDSN